MDLGSLFSGLGFTPQSNANPTPNAAGNTSSLSNWIIIIIILVLAFRYGHLRSWFSPPIYNAPIPPVDLKKKHHKKHHSHHKEKEAFPYPYFDYPKGQEPFNPLM